MPKTRRGHCSSFLKGEDVIMRAPTYLTKTKTGVYRPNKTSVGLTNSRSRKRIPDGDVLKLCVHGTLDILRNGLVLFTEKTYCPCCKQKTGPYRLNAKGKAKLTALKRKHNKK